MVITDIEKYPKAEWTVRLSAYLIDAVCAAVFGLVGYALFRDMHVATIFFETFFLFNFCLGWKFGGQTIGMRLTHIRVLTTQGEPLDWPRTLWRYVTFTVSLFSVIGMIWIIFDKQKQGLHDKLAGTYVIQMRS